MNTEDVIETLLEEPIEISADDVLAAIGSAEDDQSSLPIDINIYKLVVADFIERLNDLNTEIEEE
jgi:hypothetical protein